MHELCIDDATNVQVLLGLMSYLADIRSKMFCISKRSNCEGLIAKLIKGSIVGTSTKSFLLYLMSRSEILNQGPKLAQYFHIRKK